MCCLEVCLVFVRVFRVFDLPHALLLLSQDREIVDLNGVVEHLRQLNMRTSEQLEKLRNSSPQKEQLGETLSSASSLLSLPNIHARSPSSSSNASTNGGELDTKCCHKDFLIRLLADLLKSSTSMATASIVRHLREATFRPSYVRGLDFNLESLCKFLENGNTLQRRRSDVLDKLVRVSTVFVIKL